MLFYCLLSDESAIRDKQLLLVVQTMGDISESKLNHLVKAKGLVTAEQRLPLLEICFPTLKRRPVSEIEKILLTINNLAEADNKIDSFEYLLSRLIKQYLLESYNPNSTRLHGRGLLKDCVEELSIAASVLAANGQTKYLSLIHI